MYFVRHISYYIEGAFLLANCLKEKLQSASDNDRQVARTFAATLLCIVYKLERVASSDEDPRKQMDSLCMYIKEFLKSWIMRLSEIDGSVFANEKFSDHELKVTM